MAATNLNESKSREKYHSSLRNEKSYKTRDSFSRFGGNDDKSRENHLKYNNSKSKENNYKAKDNNYKQGEYRTRTGEDYQKSSFSYARNKDYQRSNYFDKDEEDDNKKSKRKITDSKKKNMQKDLNVQQSDKFETIMRLEREKKAIQKKHREEEMEIQKHIPAKQKRSSKNGWTKSYLNGLFDEEEYDTMD